MEFSEQFARPKAWLAWSSGKDSAWALHTLRDSRGISKLSRCSPPSIATHQRVAMHAVRESLLEVQADATGLPIVKVFPFRRCAGTKVYEQAMGEAMTQRES